MKFLPAYTPQLNPIEEVFSKCKHYIKTRNPRTLEELYDLIGTASRSITADDCEGFFAHVRTFVLKGIQGKEF